MPSPGFMLIGLVAVGLALGVHKGVQEVKKVGHVVHVFHKTPETK